MGRLVDSPILRIFLALFMALTVPGSQGWCCSVTNTSLTSVDTTTFTFKTLPKHCQLFIHASEYQTQDKQHLVTVTLDPQGIQNGCFRLEATALNDLISLKQLHAQTTSIAILNGGFFDPSNQLTVSHVQLPNGTVMDPNDNSHLTDNPNLAPYLPAIFNRSEFRQYQCTSQPTIRHEITPHNTPIPQNCQLVFALGGGPQITPTLTAQQEAFYTLSPTTRKVVRDPVRIHGKLARSAVGITSTGEIILALGRNTPETPGWSLSQVGDALTELGAVQVMALDGGSSSSMSIGAQWIPGTITTDNTPVIRRLKSFLWVIPAPPEL